MQQSIVGQDNIHPYKFSECSLDDYIAGFRDSRSMCLLNKPNEVLFKVAKVNLDQQRSENRNEKIYVFDLPV